MAQGESAGTIIFYTSSLSLFSSFLETLISHIIKIYGSNLYTSDLFMLLDEKYGDISAKTSEINDFNRLIIENVSFSYPGTGRKIVKNINLEIKKGESVCVVGRNGMGKSTLIKLLLGLYAPDEGKICIDGNSIESLRNKGVSFVSATFQDYAKYGFSLKENIVLDEPT